MGKITKPKKPKKSHYKTAKVKKAKPRTSVRVIAAT